MTFSVENIQGYSPLAMRKGRFCHLPSRALVGASRKDGFRALTEAPTMKCLVFNPFQLGSFPAQRFPLKPCGRIYRVECETFASAIQKMWKHQRLIFLYFFYISFNLRDY